MGQVLSTLYLFYSQILRFKFIFQLCSEQKSCLLKIYVKYDIFLTYTERKRGEKSSHNDPANMRMNTISERVGNYFDYDRLIDVYLIKIFNLYSEPKIIGPMVTAAGYKTRFHESEIKVYCYSLKYN